MLSEEEKEAIEFIKFYQQHCLKKEKENMKQYETVNDEEFVSKNLDTVLNLITKLQKENKEKDRYIKNKDKIIDLMADKLVEAHEWFYSEFDNFTKEDFIKYFERKVEEC